EPRPAAASEREAARGGTPQARASGDHWIARLFQAVGIDNERQLSRALAAEGLRTQTALAGADGSAAPAAALPEQPPAAADVHRHPAADSLKSVLLQLSASDAVPEPLREMAQQTLQHITGQQLLLSPDRGAVLTHLTLMLPIRHDGHEQTCAVHVQSRRGKRGELDARNCRLLFDLNMRTIGLTLVDVQVFDRKVHVQVHNDLPILGDLLERYRSEIEEGLRHNGYECVALKCGPYPHPTVPVGAAEGGEAAGAGMSAAATAAAYRAEPYKGVDVRV
ncbi:hypothetical protein PV407_16735, partial [Paenibacillus sp. GYB003]